MKKVLGTVAALGLSLSLATSPAIADTTTPTTTQSQTVKDAVVKARQDFKAAERKNLTDYKDAVLTAKQTFRTAMAAAADDAAKALAVEARKTAMKSAKKDFLQRNQDARKALKSAITAARG